MKWLKFLKAAKKRALESGAEGGGTDDSGSQHKHSKRRSMQQERKERTSIEQWHEARKSRTSIDICAAFNVTTTERLSVCKAGITLLINRTYIVIKHLGSGTSGQVKLAFNLRSKKLVAIKAVRKGGAGGGGGHGYGHQLGCRDARSYDGRGCVSSSQIPSSGGGGLAPSHSVNAMGAAGSGGGGGGGGGGLGRSWRSITPSSILRRSASSGVNASASSAALCRGSSPSPSHTRGPPGASADGSPPPGAPAASPPPEEFVREIAILKRLSHPNIVQLLEVIDDPASDCLLLVMGYVEGSTLQPQQVQPGRWRALPEQVAWRYARDVLCGLEYLHCHGVVHGDLKPANFIQDSLTGVVRIVDFGSAVFHGRMMGEDALRGAHVPMSCTPGFRSPESLAAGYRPSFELDMWALGVCLYLWVYGELPFKGSAPFVVYENIRSSPLVLPEQPRISSQLTELLTRLLDKDPHSRMTVHEAVQHPWTTAQGLAPLRTTSPLVMATRMQLAAPQQYMPPPGSQPQQPGAPSPLLPSSHTLSSATAQQPQRRSKTAAEIAAPPLSPENVAGWKQLDPDSGGEGQGQGGGSADVGPAVSSSFWRSRAESKSQSPPLFPQQWQQQPEQQAQHQQLQQQLPPGIAPPPYSHALSSHYGSSLNLCAGAAAAAAGGESVGTVGLQNEPGSAGRRDAATAAAMGLLSGVPSEPWVAAGQIPSSALASWLQEEQQQLLQSEQQQQQPPAATSGWHMTRCPSHPLAAAAAAAAAPPAQSQPPVVAAAATFAIAGGAPADGPWRMSAGPGRSNASTSSGMAAPSSAQPSHGGGTAIGMLPGPGAPAPVSSYTGMGPGTGLGMGFGAPFGTMPRITEGSVGNTGSLGGLVAAAALAVGTAGSTGGGFGSPGGGGGRRTSCEAWELRRSVTDEELQAAISSCCDPTGSAAVLMESIFTEVTFPAKHQIIRAGDPLDRIYLITAGEVEIYHDLAQDGPDAPCPHKPIIEGLSDPESELEDPGDFLNIRLPGSTVPQLERLSTGLLNITGGTGGDRSNHGAAHALSVLTAASTSVGGPSAPTTATGLGAPTGNGFFAVGNTSNRNTLTGVGGCGGSGSGAGGGQLGGACVGGGGGGGGGAFAGGAMKGSGGREPSGSIGLLSRGTTQNGHLIVAAKGPGDSLGFAGMLPGSGGFGGEPVPGRQPVWSANVRARTQVTAFAASVESLHKLARAHPQVEPLLQQMAVQQETDIAVAEAMRALRLIGGAGRGGGGKSQSHVQAPTVTSHGKAAAAVAGGGPGGAGEAAAPLAGPDGRGGGGGGAVAASSRQVRGAGGGVSSEGESESCGTAGTMATDLMTVGSSPAGSVQPPGTCSLSLWHRSASVSMPEVVGGDLLEGEEAEEGELSAMDVMLS